MNSKYSSYVIPALGTCCAVAALSIGVAVRTPITQANSFEDELGYEPNIPENLELNSNIPTMEEVVEKHLFVKERKATGANTFPDLLVKGVYVGCEEGSVIFSLKSRPTINLRVWQSDVGDTIARITDPRDPRQTIVGFLNEWDITEITFDGVVVENFITGEVETYAVNYVPAKKQKDNSESGYGQGLLAVTTAPSSQKKKIPAPKPTTAQTSWEDRRKMMENFRGMVGRMSPEQREQFARRITGDHGGSGRSQDRSSGDSSRSGGSSKGGSSRSGR